MKKTWQLINEVTNLKTKKTSLPSIFRSNDRMISDPIAIANGFCKYFTEIGPSIAKKITPTHCSFHAYFVALNWIKSYFKNRKQFVQFNNVSSTQKLIQCGVPQGSILGPLFFILYVNELPNASQLARPLLFADDTSICYSHSDPAVLVTVLN